jgi:hypothetical protein
VEVVRLLRFSLPAVLLVEVVQLKRSNARTIGLKDTEGPSEQIFFWFFQRPSKKFRDFLSRVLE